MSVNKYGERAVQHLKLIQLSNAAVMEKLAKKIFSDVSLGKSLFVFGSGHAGLFPLELYHRAGGVSFLIPVVADYLLPTAGPPVVRVLERTSGIALAVLKRAQPRAGEMLWIASQSGINAAGIDVALEAKKLGLFTVAFTSLVHSKAVPSRHETGKRLFEVCDEVVDLGGEVGDAAIPIGENLKAGPLSTLSSVFLGHSILTAAAEMLETSGHRCTYTSVNTPEGEERNQGIEAKATLRDPLLR